MSVFDLPTGYTPGPWYQNPRETQNGMIVTRIVTTNEKTIATLSWDATPPPDCGVTTDRDPDAALIALAPAMAAEIRRLEMIQADLVETLEAFVKVRP